MADLSSELADAAQTGDDARLRALLDHARDFASMPDREGWTPLHYAAYFGHEAAARYLVSIGADVHATSLNPMRNQPLHAAASGRAAAVGALLLDAGAAVDAEQTGQWTPLHAAAQTGDLAFVELLLARGAAVSPRSVSGATPVSLAREKGHEAVVALLRQQGAE